MNHLSKIWLIATVFVLAGACGSFSGDVRYPTTSSPLTLDRVVLYRNGVGYFERRGTIKGDVLTLKVRKDQINDLLKSLTVVDESSGKALSISIPLDPNAWQSAAISTLSPGNGNLAQVLDGLRGTEITVKTIDGMRHTGRIAMVEALNMGIRDPEIIMGQMSEQDHKLTLLDGKTASVIRLSEVEKLSIHDDDIVMQLHRRLDASAGEGMFQQVAIDIRLDKKGTHDLVVSYVVEAPLWKPTYRIILDEEGSKQALLQSWAIVDNTSGENWNSVDLTLTSGSPIAFRYDLHTPRNIFRPDLSNSGLQKQARVAYGETTMNERNSEQQKPAAAPRPKKSRRSGKAMYAPEEEKSESASEYDMDDMEGDVSGMGVLGSLMGAGGSSAPAISVESLQSSVGAKTTAKRVAGLTQFDLENRVTLPDGSATMVALINQKIDGEQTFLFKPGGSGSGYEYNPYRVVRFNNDTDFVLEPGPIAIYAGGSFVGEGLSEAVASKAITTIPFAVEPQIVVRSKISHASGETKLLRVVRGVLYTETFNRIETTWNVKGMKQSTAYKVLVRHPRRGSNYDLVEPKEGVEELNNAYFVPILVAANKSEASVKVVEQTPARTSISIWDGRSVKLLSTLLELSSVSSDMKKNIKPIIELRQDIGLIDTKVSGLRTQQKELDLRVRDTRKNLKAIKEDPRATALRHKLNKRLDEFSAGAAKIGRQIVELNSKRLEKKIELEDLLKDFTVDRLTQAP